MSIEFTNGKSFDAFSLTMARYVDELGMAGEKVVRQQAGLLARQLIAQTRPSSVQQAKNRIAEHVNLKAAKVAGATLAFSDDFMDREYGGKEGQGDVKWLFSTPSILVGIEAGRDYRGDSPEQLLKRLASESFNKHGMARAGNRGSQAVRIYRNWLIKKSTLKQAVALAQKGIGKLKAGWVPAWRAVGAPNGSLGPVPAKILEQPDRGRWNDGLGVPGNPSFEMINFARGANEKNCGETVRNAMAVRMKFMIADLKLYARGIKKVTP